MESLGFLFVAGVLVVLLVAAALVVAARRRWSAGQIPSSAADGATLSAGERLRRGLAATRQKLGEQLEVALRRAGPPSDGFLSEVEEALVAADVGVRTAANLVARVGERMGRAAAQEDVRHALRAELEALLESGSPSAPDRHPWVVLVTGVNGVGKTTTVGKLAALHAAAGRRVLLVAADTFRAAAIDQLAVWAERTGAALVRQAPGASPAAVAFDGIKAATARHMDVVLIDTAGRLHTRSNLMDELRKVKRVVERELPGAPHETLLVLDATTGQNAVAQARTFAEAIGITGIILTKLDGTARGGVLFAVRHEIGVPVRYIGIGEGVDDLRPFDARQFVDALLLEGEPESAPRFP
jgi:fused signal recognition particle receptor